LSAGKLGQVLDGPGHLLVRLAAVVAKQVLLGRKVVVVRCEGINISGHVYRNKVPGISPKADEHRAPSRPLPLLSPEPHFLAHCARYAAPPSQARPGCPGTPQGVGWDPSTLRQEKADGGPCRPQGCALKPTRKFAYLGRPAHEVGRKEQAATATLEEKRKEKASTNPLSEEAAEVLKTSGLLV
uniref:60S ribosomal protein L13a n=1 Tax=Peromyscus maniculatus bairdii TaxID=230844 RepID=A0A8C8UQ61_PERMB